MLSTAAHYGFLVAWRIARVLCAVLLATAPVHAGGRAAVAVPDADAGAAIYLHGITAAGTPLKAVRGNGLTLAGAAAACVNCHRRSGFGGEEGRSKIPPITGRYLFRPDPRDDGRDLPYVAGMRGDREPYNDATLARAIREGIDSRGRELDYLMPNYALSDADMSALIGYLRRLDQRHVPGVTRTTVHFATIVTPDADPAQRQGMLDVLHQYFADRNARQMALAPPLQTSVKAAYSKSMYRVHNQWELHEWELSGPAETWQAQLQKYMKRDPVFAVVSGVGGANWEPVHAFCEAQGVPCLFPNVLLPPNVQSGSYAMYFSRGVLLEGDLIGQALSGLPAPAPRVLQVYRQGDVGEAAARALQLQLTRRGVAVTDAVLAPGAPVSTLLEQIGGDDVALVLWLHADDLAHLPALPPGHAPVYMSGLMGGLEEAPLPAAWRAQTHMAYPVDLPQARRARIDFAMGWFSLRKIPLSAQQVQIDTYLACGLLSETLNHVADNFVRDYLIERVQSELEHRLLTGYYPHLTLATGQNFASKGGYLVHFANDSGPRVVPDHDWMVP